MSEGVPVELLVDMDFVALERGVDRVTAAAEVDEVEQLEVLLELILGNVEALDELVRRNDGVVPLAASGEEIREQRLQHREAFGHDGAGGAFADHLFARRGCGGC